jgi:anti-anti-sigma factor
MSETQGSETQPQIWRGLAFSVEREESKKPGTVIVRFSGPFTARDMFNILTPDALEKMFEVEANPAGDSVSLLVIDLANVPYMDSMGLGVIVTQYVRSKNKGVHLVAAGMTPRVMQLLELTKVNTVLPMAATVAEAIG